MKPKLVWIGKKKANMIRHMGMNVWMCFNVNLGKIENKIKTPENIIFISQQRQTQVFSPVLNFAPFSILPNQLIW